LRKNVAVSQVRFDVQKVGKLEEYRREIEKNGRIAVKERERMARELDLDI
jgi:hypothetical protein